MTSPLPEPRPGPLPGCLPPGFHLPGPPLPVDAVLGELCEVLDTVGVAVLEAPPGAGKTTRVPLALMARSHPGRIVLLEPRRVAARAAARRLAEQLGEPVGQRIGLTTRDERRRSAATRVEVVTEGVLLRRIQRDPALEGVGVLLFDEFHERNLEADLSLAFALEARAALREDLQVLVASATLRGPAVSVLLGGAPVIRAEGRRFPVTLEHRERPGPRALATAVAGAVTDLLDGAGTAGAATAAAGTAGAATRPSGDVLVFLPGAREIRDVAAELADRVDADRVVVRPLHGALSPADQDAALAPPPPGRRKVVLATDLAESSLTIEGVRAVVDAGLSREPRFDATTGLSGLVTVPASRASAEQRAGRAGRTAPGWCVRLWPEREHGARDADPRPAIVTDDLTAAALEVAVWGAQVADLALLDPPPARSWDAARAALTELGALDGAGRPTARGRTLAALPLHPRLGTLLLVAVQAGVPRLGAELAAVLGDRDPVLTGPGSDDADLVTRVLVLRGTPPPGTRVRRGAVTRARRERDRLLAALVRLPEVSSPRPGGGRGGGFGRAGDGCGGEHGRGDRGEDAVEQAGALVLAAWPDQLAAARPGRRGGYLLAGGRGAELHPADPLAGAPLLAVARLDRGERAARIHLAAAVEEEQVRAVLADRLEVEQEVAWRDGDVVAEVRERLGAVVLSSRRPRDVEVAARQAAVLEGLRTEGLDLLRVTVADRQLQARAALVRAVLEPQWPAIDDRTLLAEAGTTLAPFLARVTDRAGLARQPLAPILAAALGHHRLRRLEELAPTHLEVASGSRRAVDYLTGDRPVLAVRLQELFGTGTTPTILAGRVTVLLHLLSPAGRPVQVTDDLEGFWTRVYPEVRAELRGRYPRHAWPEDPRAATALRGTPRRGQRRR